MKRINLIAGILFILLIAACTREKNMHYPLTVDNPFVTFTKTNSIRIEKMELTDSATVLSVHATYRPRNWIRIAKGCKLITDKGVELPIISADGIELDSLFWMPDSGEADFLLTFGAIPMDAKFFDFIECDYDGCFNIYGIHFSPDKPEFKIPTEWKNIKYQKDETLAASIFSKDSAVISGYISGYRPEMDITMTLYYSPFGQNQKDVPVPVDVNGNFKTVVTPYLPGSAFLVMQNNAYSVFLVPGKETSLFIDLSKLSDKSYAPDYKGCMAFLQHEMVRSNNEKYNVEDLIEYDSLYEKPVSVVLPYLDDKLKEACDSIDLMGTSDAYKQLRKINAEAEYLNMRLNFDQYWTNFCLNHSNITSQEEYKNFMANFKHPSVSLVDSLKTNIPSLDCIDAPYFSLASGIFNLYIRYKDNFPAINNPDNAEIFKANALLTKFEGGNPLSEEEMKEFDLFKNPSFKDLLEERIADRQAKIEALKENKSVHIHELDDVAPDKILTAILEKYKGKAVFFDIWATWCGPCRIAHKTILPLKEELKNEDILFVYLTGPTSPVDKWSEMLKEISGEHYYLTNEQYQSILSQYESQGVPTYLIFDRNGKFVYKSVGYPGNETMKANLVKAMEM